MTRTSGIPAMPRSFRSIWFFFTSYLFVHTNGKPAFFIFVSFTQVMVALVLFRIVVSVISLGRKTTRQALRSICWFAHDQHRVKKVNCRCVRVRNSERGKANQALLSAPWLAQLMTPRSPVCEARVQSCIFSVWQRNYLNLRFITTL